MSTIAVVTGAGGGLGQAVVSELLDAGTTPVLLDIAPDALEASADRVEQSHGRRPATIVCDVTDAGAVEAAAAQVLREHGGCDVLVNNAGILERAPLEEHPIDVWDRVISVNLRGYFVCTQAFGRLMLAGDGGSIVNVSSLAGESPSHANGAYCASKAGVLALTRSTAVEWGPRGVRANAVSPGYMPTAMTGHIDADEAAARLRSVPLGRAAETAEIASVIAFLAGPDASYLSGVNVRVDGGLTHARAGRR